MISDAIIKRIFNFVGLPTPGLSDEFLLEKKISIEMEDGEHIDCKIWGILGKSNFFNIKMLITDLSTTNDKKEYVFVFQLDDLSVFCLKMCENISDIPNKAYTLYDDTSWIELTNLALAKLLVGIEQLNELFVDFGKFTNYDELYKYLINFLNYEEQTQINK